MSCCHAPSDYRTRISAEHCQREIQSPKTGDARIFVRWPTCATTAHVLLMQLRSPWVAERRSTCEVSSRPRQWRICAHSIYVLPDVTTSPQVGNATNAYPCRGWPGMDTNLQADIMEPVSGCCLTWRPCHCIMIEAGTVAMYLAGLTP